MTELDRMTRGLIKDYCSMMFDWHFKIAIMRAWEDTSMKLHLADLTLLSIIPDDFSKTVDKLVEAIKEAQNTQGFQFYIEALLKISADWREEFAMSDKGKGKLEDIIEREFSGNELVNKSHQVRLPAWTMLQNTHMLKQVIEKYR